jgi:hypothetical protein
MGLYDAKPAVTTNDPYANMPTEIKDFLIGSVGELGDSNDRANALRDLYSDPSKLIAPYAGQEGVATVMGSAEAGMGAAGDAMDAASQYTSSATRGLSNAVDIGREGLGGVNSRLMGSSRNLAGINTNLGSAPNVSGTVDRLTNLGDRATSVTNRAAGDMRDAAGNISNVSTDLGAAFDTTGAQRDLTGMDIAGMQDRYQSDYIEGMVDPVMSRMREDEARRLAEIEGSSAAIGGSSNTRMAVEAARLSDESSRSRAQTEAEMRQTSLREGQALGLQEAGLRGDLTNMAAQLGLSQSELEASIREREASLGISREQAIADISQNAGQLQLEGIGAAGDLSQAAAQLGMDRAELEASIRERAAQLGISVEEAQRAVLGDISANIGAQYGMSADLADQNNTAANTSLDIGQLGIGAAGLGMAAGGVQIDEAERERALTQEAQQAPLTMESWYRNLVSGGPAIAPPSTNTATQTGGGPSTAAQILGGITSIGGLLFSDENVKTDVEQLGGALDIIRKQRPSVYSYTDPVYDRVPIEGRRSAGLMAQDLEDIPGAVFETESGIKMVDSYPVMATIAAALQELDAKVEAMSHGG